MTEGQHDALKKMGYLGQLASYRIKEQVKLIQALQNKCLMERRSACEEQQLADRMINDMQRELERLRRQLHAAKSLGYEVDHTDTTGK